MTLAQISRDDVLAAVAEYDSLGRDRFLETYGFGCSRRYVVMYEDQEYDSRALLGVAHRNATGSILAASEISGGVATVGDHMGRLGFDFRDTAAVPKVESAGVIGDVPGVMEGTTFGSRAAVAEAGVHRALQAGIVGTSRAGAESVVVSGGYEDDEDHGDLIIYTGHGGRDPSGRQVRDQSFSSSGNAALRTSCIQGTAVRVVRGPDRASAYSPASGYRYDGLFRVEDAWHAPGRSGYHVCRFRLVKIMREAGQVPESGGRDGAGSPAAPQGNAAPGRRSTRVQRIVRSTAVADYVKRLYDHRCQTCGTRIDLGDRGYSEGAHIRPLGRPHDGSDIAANVLCLCPNCHVLFDNGSLIIDEDESVLVNGAVIGALHTHPAHGIDSDHLAYHRTTHQGLATMV